jgi:hypothetical protein
VALNCCVPVPAIDAVPGVTAIVLRVFVVVVVVELGLPPPHPCSSDAMANAAVAARHRNPEPVEKITHFGIAFSLSFLSLF